MTWNISNRLEALERLSLRSLLGDSTRISILAIVLAVAAGAVLIAATDPEVLEASRYFLAAPGATLAAVWDAVTAAYLSLFRGAIYDFRQPSVVEGFAPVVSTLTFATPLIAAGLGIALADRAGLFNIGGQGQMLVAAAAAGWVAFAVHLPPAIHLLVAVAAGLAAGSLWGAVVGVLKAKTGAHEVIVTIMLNYIAFYAVFYLLSTPGLLQAPGSGNPKTPSMLSTSVFPPIPFLPRDLQSGFLVVVAATVWVSWLLKHSSMGFRFRAVGENPSAARVAGISVGSTYTRAMLISGGLVGLAGVNQVLGTVTSGFGSGIDAGIGFEAITVALLGRSRPWGVFAAGVLFGAFKAGGFTMQASAGVSIDIVAVVQSMIVLFIAAPPLVRAVFRLRDRAAELPMNVGEVAP